MPEAAVVSFKAGIQSFSRDYQTDFSLSIISISKSLEIILKTQIFDIYRENYGYSFEENLELSLSNQNSKAQRFISFIAKPPHFIEMGSMELILKLKGGRTEKKEPLLQDFFQFIESESNFNRVLDKEFIQCLEEIRKIRNLKTHSEIAKCYEATEFIFLILKTFQILFENSNNRSV
jgi:hypothetical protein